MTEERGGVRLFSFNFYSRHIWSLDGDLFGRHWFGIQNCNENWFMGLHIGPFLKTWSRKAK